MGVGRVGVVDTVVGVDTVGGVDTVVGMDRVMGKEVIGVMKVMWSYLQVEKTSGQAVSLTSPLSHL